MIDTIKRWIEKTKSSPILKPFIKTKVWFQEKIIKRKLVIFSMLFVTWLSLLMGAIFSPQRQTYTSEQLKTKQVFANGSGEMKLVSQEYSPDTGIIVLQFETKDATTSIDRGIDAKRLKWKLYAQHKDSKIEMNVVPIIDNKVSVIIKGVPKNFGAFAIDVTNQTVSSSSIDVNISSPSSDSKKVSQKKSGEGDTVQFFVTPQNTQLEIKSIEVVSREEFTLQEIEKEISFQNDQSQKLTTSIAQLKESIEDDNSRKASLQAEAKYLTGDDLEANQKNIATLDTNIETKNRTIETAYKNIEKLKAKLESLDKKKQAVKDGTFEFSNPIETVEMN